MTTDNPASPQREIAPGVERCCRVRMKNWRKVECKNAAKVVRDGKPYCGIHDPEARKERQAVRDEERRRTWEARAKLRPVYTEEEYAAMRERAEAAERALADAEVKVDLFHRFVKFAAAFRAPTWMPQRFLDECRTVAAICNRDAALGQRAAMGGEK